jgi:hypothetical protein
MLGAAFGGSPLERGVASTNHEASIMRRMQLGTVALIGLSTARVASPTPAPDWSLDRFLIGNWSCEQTRAGQKSGSEDASYRFELDGRWLQLTYTFTPSGSDRPSKTTTAYETFDSSLAKWVYVAMTSDGNYGISHSDGWKGHTKTYGPPAAEPQTWRLVATKVSDDEFTEDVDAATADGSWSRTVSLKCQRLNRK